MILSSKPSKRVWPLPINCGSKVPARSRGTTDPPSPSSRNTLLALTLDPPFTILGQPRFGALPVATVAAAPASRVALLVAKMIGQLRPEGTFNQRFLQSPEQAVIARQILRLLVTRKQLIQKFRRQCRGRRHVSSFAKGKLTETCLHKITDTLPLPA